MSGKRPSLAESMRQAVAGDEPAQAPVSSAPAPPAPPPRRAEISSATSTTDTVARSPGFYAATRIGKKKVTATLDPAAHKQLKGLAVERDGTTEALLTEAINDLFAKYGKARIA
jgi:hypothetical protein